MDENHLTLGRFLPLKPCIPLPQSVRDQNKPEGGTYMATSAAFACSPEMRTEKSRVIEGGHIFEGWAAFSKGTRLVDKQLLTKESQDQINRKDLRYIAITHDRQMHVYTSKKANDDKINSNDSEEAAVKVLKMTKNMEIKVEYLSRQHGHCIIVHDFKISNVVCTIYQMWCVPFFLYD